MHDARRDHPRPDRGGDAEALAAVGRALSDASLAGIAQRIVAMEENELRLKGLEGLRKTFISEASHELNTPLTPLGIHVEALAETEGLTPEHRHHLAIIQRNVARLRSLVKCMLEASRLETGRFRLEIEDAPLALLLGEAVDGLSEAAAAAQVTLLRGHVEHVVVCADRDRVGQVLQNLIGNAIRFTPAGGRVTVHARRDGPQAVVRVSDTGIGLSPQQIGQLFQPFSRPHEGAGAPKGTGLGLFISKGIVEQHGGRVWAESQGPGAGSSFCFSLPLTQPGGLVPEGAARAHSATDPLQPVRPQGLR